jgi:predicted dehydrogenase
VFKNTVGIGIIGAGFGARVQLPGFLGIPEVSVIGVASRNAAHSMEIAKLHGLPQIFSSPKALIASSEVDLVSIAVPQSAHEEYVLAAIAARKHILCEKPFTLKSSTAQSLLQDANAVKIVHAIDFEFRELPAWQLLRNRLTDGSLGKIQRADFRWIVGTWSDPKRPWGWQCDNAKGGGVLSALGVHLFDAVEWCIGPVQKLNAMTGIAITERPSGDGVLKPVSAEDHAIIEMKCENGIPVTIALSNVDPRGKGLSISIVCEKGTIHVESTMKEFGCGLRVREKYAAHTEQILLEPDERPEDADARTPIFRKFATHLVHAVQNQDTTFHPSFFEGVRTQIIRETILRSSTTKQWERCA